MRTHAIPAAVRLGLPLAATAMLLAACGSNGSSGATTGSSGSSGSSGSEMATMVKTTSGSHGTFLVDGSGHALYLFAKDQNGKSSCDGTCASFWPPAEVQGSPQAGGAVKSGDLGTVKRSDGATQVTYHGHPLYYFSEDSAAGDTKGQGRDDFGGTWSLVTPAGAPVSASGSKGSGSGSGGGSEAGGGWG
jgi:predicted lipoprotein with Yx(FWY)xxD motif